MTTLTTRQFATRAALDTALEERLAKAIAVAGPSAIMLSGGQTPLPAYRALASRALASRAAGSGAAGSGASGRDPLRHDSGLRIVFSDDRYVPADSESSNYHQSRPLLDALALSAGAVLRVRTELPLEDAAADYERQLAALIAAGVPVRLGLLGLGADGHTASLFSTADLERARGRLAIAVHRPDGLSAVSVTPEFLARIVEPVFVIAGQGKDAAISRLKAQDLQLIAWRAMERCARVEAWVLESA